jgi:nucleoside-diphosphate-sugar epimerase
MPIDDPQRRRADTTRAKECLQWEPKWELWQGVEEMVSRPCRLSLTGAGALLQR